MTAGRGRGRPAGRPRTRRQIDGDDVSVVVVVSTTASRSLEEQQLTALGQKFEAIKEQMVANSMRYDRLLLGIFRPGQYRKYEAMCREVNRLPLEPTSKAFLEYNEN